MGWEKVAVGFDGHPKDIGTFAMVVEITNGAPTTILAHVVTMSMGNEKLASGF
jgi:hypothetical protein